MGSATVGSPSDCLIKGPADWQNRWRGGWRVRVFTGAGSCGSRLETGELLARLGPSSGRTRTREPMGDSLSEAKGLRAHGACMRVPESSGWGSRTSGVPGGGEAASTLIFPLTLVLLFLFLSFLLLLSFPSAFPCSSSLSFCPGWRLGLARAEPRP